MSETLAEPVEIDVRAIPKIQRHPLIFDAMEKLQVGESLVVKNDHNPIPLRGQLETLFGDQFQWNYLEEGPEVFRLCFTRHAAAPAGRRRPESKQSELPMAAPDAASTREAPVRVDLLEKCGSASHSGPQWAHESADLDLTLLSWGSGRRVEAHVNNEVDVVLLGIEGEGRVIVNEQSHEVRSGVALLIPKGCERAIESASGRFSYLSVHRRRRGLMPTLNGRALS